MIVKCLVPSLWFRSNKENDFVLRQGNFVSCIVNIHVLILSLTFPVDCKQKDKFFNSIQSIHMEKE